MKELTAKDFKRIQFEGTPSCSVQFWTDEMVEQYANAKLLKKLNAIQSYIQGADEDMIYDYIEKMKNNE